MPAPRSHPSRAVQCLCRGKTPNPWALLPPLAVAQLTVVLDATVVNIAPRSAERAPHLTDEHRQSTVTAHETGLVQRGES